MVATKIKAVTETAVKGMINKTVDRLETKIDGQLDELLAKIEALVERKVQAEAARDDVESGVTEAQVKRWMTEAISQTMGNSSAGASGISNTGLRASRGSEVNGGRGIYPTLTMMKKNEESLITHLEPFISNLWDKGCRILDRDGSNFPTVVRKAIAEALKVTDQSYSDTIQPFVSKVFHDRMKQKFENAKSKYRSDLTKHRKCYHRRNAN